MANKEFTVKINGAENVEKLADSLDKVDVKTNNLAMSADNVADVYKKGFEDISEHAILHTAKIGAVVTELTGYTEQAIEKNKEAAEKLVQDVEQSEEGILSSIKATIKKLPVVMEGYANMTSNLSNLQSNLLEEQTNKNKELIDEITQKYAEKETKIEEMNLTAYKEYVERLKSYKTEVETAILQTDIQYDSLSAHYNKDSEEFKKYQEEKKAALESLQKKVEEINTKIEESNINFLEKWNKLSDEAIAEVAKKSKTISDAVNEMTKSNWSSIEKEKSSFQGINDSIKSLIKPIDDLQASQKALYEQELKYIDEKTKRKKAELDEDIKKLEQEAKDIKKEQEVDKLTYEKGVADSNTSRYTTKISELEKDHKLEKDAESGEYKEVAGWDEMSPEQQKEIEDAKDRLAQLNDLKKQEEEASAEKAQKIKEANDLIFKSEQKVLEQKQELEAKKAELDRKAAEEKAKTEEKKAKKEEQIAKLTKIKNKAEQVIKIAQATSDIAKGVAVAWSKGPILGPALAALVALQGGMQVKIMTEQLKYMKDGGLLNGKRHSQGGMRIEGTNIEVEGGEYVVNRESTSKNLGLVRYINSQRKELTAADMTSFFAKASQGYEPPFRRQFAVGGQMPAIENPNSINNDAIVKAIQEIRIEPKVAVTDILRVQDEMVNVNGWAGN